MECTRILAIRHGETDWNVDTRVQGHLDMPLNAAGRAQARRLARALADEPLAAVYTSDLRRALDTARDAALAGGAPLRPVPALRERCLGDFQGHTFAEVSQRWPQEAARWRRRDPDWRPPGEGAESLAGFRQRVTDAVAALAAAHLGQQIAIVTHGGVLDILYRAAAGLGLRDARTWLIGNAAINRLLWTPDSGLGLIGWADTTHLNQESLDESTA